MSITVGYHLQSREFCIHSVLVEVTKVKGLRKTIFFEVFTSQIRCLATRYYGLNMPFSFEHDGSLYRRTIYNIVETVFSMFLCSWSFVYTDDMLSKDLDEVGNR